MALVVRSNTASIFAQNRLNKSQANFNQSLERLASGARINKSADDAAGMAISTSLEHRLVGQQAAIRNANEGISLIQTAEGGVDQIRSMLDRMRELAVRSSSETLNATDRANADTEYQQLLLEIDRVATNTNFNGGTLLASSLELTFQVGYQNLSSNQLVVTISGGLGAASLGVSGGGITDVSDANDALAAISGALSAVNTYRSKLGAVQNRLERSIANLEADIENTTASNSRIRDVDFAAETANFTRAQILVQSGTAILAQANSAPQAALSLLG